uniref:Rho guanine nucleotide exchange factor 26 n=1 Tax=Electrophorus electricus TaxID=8005 RepID=A0AAY5EDF6_ELEEL
MDLGNDVDLSNNYIAPLWRTPDQKLASGNMKPKPRPLSYQIDGVLMTDFPVEDKCAFAPGQPAEKTCTPPAGTTVLKHVLNKPPRKARVVRSISIGHSSNGRFSLVKFGSLGGKDTVDNRPPKTPPLSSKTAENGLSVWRDMKVSQPLKRQSGQLTLTSQRDRIVFGSTSLTDLTSSSQGSPMPRSPSEVRGSPACPHPPSSPGSASSLSTSSTSSSTPSTPFQLATPCGPCPSEAETPPLRLSACSSQGPEGGLAAPAVVLSTHSPTAQRMGARQIIPYGLASETRPCRGPDRRGLVGRAIRARSMVDVPSFDEDSDTSPTLIQRGLRSTSYRRAVVSGVDLAVSDNDLRGLHLPPPTLKGVAVPKEAPGSPRTAKSKVSVWLRTQGRLDEVLYQNYQEKALHDDSDEDVESRDSKPNEDIVVQYKPIRTSWSQLSVVKRLSQEERKRQEAIFEVISSEHSYLHSLLILVRLFKDSPELSETMTKTERHHLFSNIVDVCEASKKFFKELEDRHQQSIVIDDISDIVVRHAQSNFEPYVTYCSNEVYQQRTLQRLVSKNVSFKEALTRIEAHPDCRNLPMSSFLILPMQRVTRLPLLMDTICQKTSKESCQYEQSRKALHVVSKLVRKCNEGARTMERTEMMYTINSQLDFKIKAFPLVSSSRWMVKRGELTAFVEENGIFSRRTSRQQVYLFLFNDVLIVTRKKSEESYAVIDYALRDQIWVGPCQPEDLTLSPTRTTAAMLTSRQGGASHLLRLKFLSNHSGDKVPMILGAELLNERARWISALDQKSAEKRNADRINSMQVEVIRTYTARQPDELSLQVADVVLVSQTVDGWYEGERLRDGERGWFQSECAQPITCQVTIEKNMQRMDRLQGLETNV